jgi:hypothetical protein
MDDPTLSLLYSRCEEKGLSSSPHNPGVPDPGFRIKGLGLRVEGLGFRV